MTKDVGDRFDVSERLFFVNNIGSYQHQNCRKIALNNFQGIHKVGKGCWKYEKLETFKMEISN